MLVLAAERGVEGGVELIGRADGALPGRPLPGRLQTADAHGDGPARIVVAGRTMSYFSKIVERLRSVALRFIGVAELVVEADLLLRRFVLGVQPLDEGIDRRVH